MKRTAINDDDDDDGDYDDEDDDDDDDEDEDDDNGLWDNAYIHTVNHYAVF